MPGELAVGDELLTSEGEVDYVDSVEYVEGKVTVYNLQIEDTHTYYAGGLGVHNRIIVKEK